MMTGAITSCGPAGRRCALARGIVAAAAFVAGAAHAAAPANDAIVKPVFSQQLGDAPGKEVVMMTVEYLPGGASLPHRHNADVFVYVLSGSLRTQVAGHDPVVLKAGQVFYEGPDDIHQTSANASAKKPVKFLVIWLKNQKQPLSEAVAPPPGG
jgi:quercetin dioxygenase-like cupin family protein